MAARAALLLLPCVGYEVICVPLLLMPYAESREPGMCETVQVPTPRDVP